MRTLACLLLLAAFGCEEIRRNGRPGDTGYIAPEYVKVKVIEFEPELIKETSRGPVIRQSYSVLEDEDGKRYRAMGKVGPVGDTFRMDVSLMEEIGS